MSKLQHALASSTRPSVRGLRLATVATLAVAALVLAGCSSEDPVARAQAQVDAKEKALAEAEDAFDDASAQFCGTSEDYVAAIDRYGDLINDTAPTVGDVRTAGKDLAAPGADAAAAAQAAVTAQQDVIDAQHELENAQARLEQVKEDPSAEPTDSDSEAPDAEPLAPEKSVERVQQAEADFADVQGDISDDTPLADASEQFKSAVVALELAWLQLLGDTGCLTDEQVKDAEATVTSLVKTVQTALKDAGYYDGAIDGIPGPQTIGAIEALQKAHDLPVTGALDKDTIAALEADVEEKGGEEAQEKTASTAAVQQTLKICGFWDGPVDGKWTDELTEALKDFQVALGVEPTGKVDSDTIKAFEKKLEEIQQPDPEPTPSPSPSQ